MISYLFGISLFFNSHSLNFFEYYNTIHVTDNQENFKVSFLFELSFTNIIDIVNPHLRFEFS
jgi:hypothetical protein